MNNLLNPDVYNQWVGRCFLRDKTDAATRQLLLQTALLPKISCQAAERLSGLPQAGALLADLSRRNYFTYAVHAADSTSARPKERRNNPYRAAVPRYQYHPLLRAFLLARLHRSMTPEALQALQTRAALLLEAEGETEDALALLREAQAWEAMVPVLLRHAPVLIAEGRGQLLGDYLQSLPKAIRQQQPWLLYWLGVCDMMLHPQACEGLLQQAFAKFCATSDHTGALLACATTLQFLWLQQDDLTRADPWLDWLKIHLRKHPQMPSPQVECLLVNNVVNLMIFRRPQYDEIQPWIAWAARLTEQQEDMAARLQAGHVLAFYYVVTGQHSKCATLLAWAAPALQSADAPPLMKLLWKVVEGFYTLFAVSLASSAALTEAALQETERLGIHILDHWFIAQLGYAALTKGDVAVAAQQLAKLKTGLPQRGRVDVSHYHHLSSWHALLTHNYVRAAHHAETALKLAQEGGALVPEAFCHAAMVYVRLQQGDFQAADDHLAQLRQIAMAARSGFLHYTYGLAAAYCALTRGCPAAAIETLREAFATGSHQGYTVTTLWQPDVVSVLCAFALAHGIETDYARKIIEMHQLAPPEGMQAEAWPWPIKIYTLGVFAVHQHGTPIAFGHKAQRKPLELLKILISQHGRRVTQDYLGDVLWEDIEADKVPGLLRVTLHRLRKLLGSDQAILLQGSTLSLNPQCVWVDTWSFDSFCNDVEQQLKQTPPDPAAIETLSNQLKALYRGHFLTGDPPWSLPLRENSRNKFIRTLGKIGQHWEHLARWDQATTLYEHGLGIDAGVEGFYRGLMRCYLGNQRPDQALYVYTRCHQNLGALLNTSPSTETEAIRDAILSVSV